MSCVWSPVGPQVPPVRAHCATRKPCNQSTGRVHTLPVSPRRRRVRGQVLGACDWAGLQGPPGNALSRALGVGGRGSPAGLLGCPGSLLACSQAVCGPRRGCPSSPRASHPGIKPSHLCFSLSAGRHRGPASTPGLDGASYCGRLCHPVATDCEEHTTEAAARRRVAGLASRGNAEAAWSGHPWVPFALSGQFSKAAAFSSAWRC